MSRDLLEGSRTRTKNLVEKIIKYSEPGVYLLSSTIPVEPFNKDIVKGRGKFLENLSEYAARVCYNSEDKMGRSPNFLTKRIEEGHMDVFEHSRVSFMFDMTEDCSFKYTISSIRSTLNDFLVESGGSIRYLETSSSYAFDDSKKVIFITGHLRSWHELHSKVVSGDYKDLMLTDAISIRLIATLPYLVKLAPKIFLPINYFGSRHTEVSLSEIKSTLNRFEVEPAPRTRLLGVNVPENKDSLENPVPDKHLSFTFEFTGITRALTHQLVRHRRGSFSQISQRYVDLEKGNWNNIIPRFPYLYDGERSRVNHLLGEISLEIKEKYEKLRKIGVRKEDARALLMNMTETRIIVTMNLEDWRHFFWMRALDKAAQYEIRTLGLEALVQVQNVVPERLKEEVDYLEKNLDRLTNK